MRLLYTTLLLATLAVPAALPTHAQDAPDIDGVFVGASGDADFGASALSMFNPEPGAPVVALTPFFTRTSHSGRDTLGGRVLTRAGNGGGVSSFEPSMSRSGRTAFLVDWFVNQGAGIKVVAQDRDGSNRVVLVDDLNLPFTSTLDISPDGQTVLLAAGQLYTVPADGSAPARVLDISTTDDCSGAAVDVTFSPDGSQIAFLGYASDPGFPPNRPCRAALYIANADGTGARFVQYAGADSWTANDAGIDWKAGKIVYTTATLIPGRPYATPRIVIYDVAAETSVDIGSSPNNLGRHVQLSPDGAYLGYLIGGGPTFFKIEVRPISGGTPYVFDGFPYGRRPTFDWADAPPIPAPARMALEIDGPGVLLWEGRSVALNPTLYGADGSVISRTVNVYSGTPFVSLNHFTSEMWGIRNNVYRQRICAENAGLSACTTYNNVHSPVIDAVVIDDDIAEEGRNPGVLRLYRYGRPDITSLPVYEAQGASARHYLDFTLSRLPERLRWPASDALSDTLQTIDIVLTPIDDGIAEPPFETTTIYLACFGGSGGIFGPREENCTIGGFPLGGGSRFRIPGAEDGIAGGTAIQWNVQIASNGAGSGLAIATSAPSVIPASGQATLTIQGQGFVEGATATLSGPGSVQAVNVTPQFGGVQALARFELSDLPPGTYDLTVTSGGETDVLEDAVTVQGGTPGGFTDVWATLQSNSGRLLLPRDQVIHYGNDGTADAALTPLLIAVPEGYEPEFKDALFKFPVTIDGFDPDASPWITHQARVGDVPGLCFRSRRSGSGRFSGLASAAIDCENLFTGGEAAVVNYQVAVVFLPTIPPGGRGSLTVSMTRQADSESFRPWFVRVGAPFNTLDLGEEDASQIADRVWDGGARPVSPTNVNACTVDAQGQLNAQFDASTAAACASCLNFLLDLLLEASGVGDCANIAIDLAQGLYQTGIDAAAGADGFVLAADGASTIANVAISAAMCAGRANPVAAGLSSAYAVLTNLSSGLACVDCLSEIAWGVIGEVYSSDPNDKLGPVGVGAEGYVSEFGRAGYTIRFENLATATASAVEVTVVDTLDTSVYDLSTFELAEISLRDITFTPPPGVQNWTATWDRRPAVNSLVRVLAGLDAASGEVRWTLSDLDPTTYRLRTSAEAGFLPPNDADGSGEGQIRFMIRAKPDLPDGTEIANGATIQFDRNELIVTPTWANTIDRNTPISRVVSAERFDADTSFVVRFEGSDPGSGIRGYDLYVSADSGPFQYYAGALADSIIFRGEQGVSYRAFALGKDWVGNIEAPKTEAELSFGVSVPIESGAGGPTELELAAPYPNPARGDVVVQVGVPQAGLVRMALYDVQGREVAVLVDGDLAAGWHTVRWDTGGLASGVYVVRARALGRTVTRSVTVVR